MNLPRSSRVLLLVVASFSLHARADSALQPPASMEEIAIKSGGARINGFLHGLEDAASLLAWAKGPETGAKRVRLLTYEDDHPFSAHRIELANALVRWLQTDCARTQAFSNRPN
jgi:hypothetical protein